VTDDVDDAAALQRRLEGFREFARWEATQKSTLPPALAIEIATSLYDLLPAESRRPAVDPSGVMRMQRLLRVLMPSR
jgi:hypothetical protein